MLRITNLLFFFSLIVFGCKTEEIVTDPKSSDTAITQIALKSIAGATVVYDSTNHTYTVKVPSETNLTSLIIDFKIPSGATSSPDLGVAQDFTQPVTYTITAEDGSKSIFSVKVERLSSENKILSFVFNDLEPEIIADIDEERKEISAEVSPNVNLTKLRPTISISEKAKILPSSNSYLDFSNTVTYSITAEDGNNAKYEVKISQETGLVTNKRKITKDSSEYELNYLYDQGNKGINASTIGTTYLFLTNEKLNRIYKEDINDNLVLVQISFNPSNRGNKFWYENLTHGAILSFYTKLPGQAELVPIDIIVGGALTVNYNRKSDIIYLYFTNKDFKDVPGFLEDSDYEMLFYGHFSNTDE